MTTGGTGFTDLFIQRPVLSLVLAAFVLLIGLQAARHLTIRQFPEVEKSVIHVRAVYPGASARTVQGFVTTPLQRKIASAKGVEYLTSRSDTGVSSIEVKVRLGENSTEVLTEVITKVNEARFELPREVEDPVVSNTTGGDAMMYLAMLSEQMSIQQIADYGLRYVQPVLSTVEGVGEVRMLSSGFFAMRVWLNPARMAAFGVTAQDINDAIRRDNYLSAAGTTRGELVQASVYAATDMQGPQQFAEIVVRQDGDQRVLLGDVAEVELASSDYDSAAYSSGRETVFISVTEAPGANPLEVARRIKKAVADLEQTLPADLRIFLDSDGSIYIQEALWEVAATLLEATVIVILVILLFLGSLRVVAIPLIAIPLSLVGVLVLIWVLGFSINLLTLLAMVIAIGLVVDDAIVVVENVQRHIEDGLVPREAALLGARQVALPVIAMTLTLVAVYLPIAFVGGLTGVLFSEFALTLAGAVLVSGLIALTLSPMMSAYLLSARADRNPVASWLEMRFRQLHDTYVALLNYWLRNLGAVLLFAVLILLSLPLLFQLANRELAPTEDSGGIFAIATPPDYGNLDYTTFFLDQMVAAWKTIPEVSHSWQVNSPNSVFGGLELVPWSKRERSLEEIRTELQAKYDRISGLEIVTFAPNPMPGAGGGLPVAFVISSNDDYQELNRVAEEVLARARKSGLFAFVIKDLRYARPEVSVAVDRELAARLGVSMQDIGETLQVMLGEAETNRFSMEGRAYKVIPQAGRGFRLTKEWLERYYVRTSQGDLIPLSTLIDLRLQVEPNTLNQYQQLNSVTIQGLMRPPATLGTGLDFLESALRETAPSYRIGHEGESLRYIQENQGFLLLFGSSMLFIYLVLAAQFNSFRDPLVVLISVPLSIFGALIPLALGTVTLNIYTQVGLLTLIGLISKHGILIVDFANQLVLEGKSRFQAVVEAASLRLRPILMTTFATVLGVVPLLIAEGAGANSRFAIGLMIAAGMTVGTLFTLFVLPAFYLLLSPRVARGRANEQQNQAPALPAGSTV